MIFTYTLGTHIRNIVYEKGGVAAQTAGPPLRGLETAIAGPPLRGLETAIAGPPLRGLETAIADNTVPHPDGGG